VNSGEVAELYSASADALVRFAASQVGWSDADDVVSAAVIGVVRTDLVGVDEPTAYLYRPSPTRAASTGARSTAGPAVRARGRQHSLPTVVNRTTSNWVR
jgi:DNA-directed RNA polymerase specialized sigma24 family protein